MCIVASLGEFVNYGVVDMTRCLCGGQYYGSIILTLDCDKTVTLEKYMRL